MNVSGIRMDVYSNSPLYHDNVLNTCFKLKEKARLQRLIRECNFGVSPCFLQSEPEVDLSDTLNELKALQKNTRTPNNPDFISKKLAMSEDNEHRRSVYSTPGTIPRSEKIRSRIMLYENDKSLTGLPDRKYKSRMEAHLREILQSQPQKAYNGYSRSAFSTPTSNFCTPSRSISLDRIRPLLDFAKTSLADLSRWSPFSSASKSAQRSALHINNRNQADHLFQSASSPEIMSLEGESNSANEEEKDQKIVAPNVTSRGTIKSSGDLVWRLQAQTADLCQKINQSNSSAAELRRAETETLILEAKLRLEARLHKRRSLEDEVKLRIRLEGLILPEPEEEKEFVALNDEQVNELEKALQRSDGEVLVEAFNIEIRTKDLVTLCGSNWLNDEVVNFYFNLLMARSGKDGLPSVYVFNTFFYPKLCQGGHSVLKRWTKKVDIFAYNMILVPVHLGVHWCLAVMDFRKKSVSYYDSMGGFNLDCIKALKKYLKDESLDKKKVDLDLSDWKEVIVENIPQQMNGSDCGVFTCKFADFISRDLPIKFAQQHMPYFRRRIMYEILKSKLL